PPHVLSNRRVGLVGRPGSVDMLGATAGLPSSVGGTVGSATRGTRRSRSVEALAQLLMLRYFAYFGKKLVLGKMASTITTTRSYLSLSSRGRSLAMIMVAEALPDF